MIQFGESILFLDIRIQALAHWTGKQRLPAEQAEKLIADYRVMAVLGKIKALQVQCQRAGIAVPLDAVLNRDKRLRLPGQSEAATTAQAPSSNTRQSSSAAAEAAATKAKGPATKKSKKGRKEEEAGEDAKKNNQDTGFCPLTSTSAYSSSASTIEPVRMEIKAPETLFGWLHLFSPLIMLGLGFCYVLWWCPSSQVQRDRI